MSDLRDLHRKITGDIVEEYTKKSEASIEEKRTRAAAADEKVTAAIEAGQAAGFDLKRLADSQAEREKRAEAEFKAADASMARLSRKPPASDGMPNIDRNLLPPGAQLLTPSWVASFTDDDAQDTKTATALVSAQDLLSGGGCQDYWNYASGGGWGCLGSGVGEIQNWLYYGFWYLPPTSRYYSVVPLFQFRGYTIVKADDGFWDCKNARVVGSAWTNVYQYNWKGWNSVNVYDVGGDNINVNVRQDLDRWVYNSFLLGAGDWAWISCAIGLYARAQGGGSYAKNDFATGDANFACVPYCSVY